MPLKDTALRILGFVGLIIPAVAIYLEIIYSNQDTWMMDDMEAANFHGIRMTFVLLLGTSLLLLIEILFTPPGLERLLVGAAIVLLGFSLITFVLPLLFNREGLEDHRSILWVYRNAWHRLRDLILGARPAEEEEE